MDTALVALTIGVVMVSGFVHAATGMGFAMLSMAVLTLLLSPVESAAIVSCGILVLITHISIKLRKHINWRIALPPMLAMTVGKAVGMVVLMNVTSMVLRRSLGILLVLLAIFFYFLQSRIRIKPTVLKGCLLGLGAGVLGGVYNLSGPLAAIYFFSACEDKSVYSASMNAAFLPSAVLGVAMHFFYGNMTPTVLFISAVDVLAIMAGTFVGLRLFNKLNRRRLTTLLYAYMAAMGLFLAIF